jgi:acyl-[acyl-carrier-protein]-phospholipid O-acyltransferase/long-chain-fatty-acid--[acyl-carrier-protein] ligase
MSPSEPSNFDELILPRKFLRVCHRQMRMRKVADSMGTELTGANLLLRTLILRRILRRDVFAPDEQCVGILLPPSVPCLVVNAALAIDRRVSVNLNYTVSEEVMNDCIAQCGIRHVLTSRRVMERFNFKLNCKTIFLEDFKDKATLADKLISAAATWLTPVSILERWLKLDKVQQDDLLTVIFTSGSTGRPKGVMLTHRNIGANVTAINQIVHLTKEDVLVGILPIFHSFGYTTTMWTVLALEPSGIYHFSPLEAREVGKLCRKYGATIMVTTPTFVRSYLRRCEPEDFAALNVVFTGAEKLPVELCDAFEKRFGVRPTEGYGATELSPVVAGNIPPRRAPDPNHIYGKDNTVGRPLPGVIAKTVDLDTGEDLGPGQPGMLLVSGPSVMKGYWGQPELTAAAMRDGWYVTGDVAIIDEEGFIQITGRISRFSKIAGEMVPHIRVEEAIQELLNLDPEAVSIAVSAIPDVKKGERLVVLYTELDRTPEEVCRGLLNKGLPPLWVPSPDCFRRIEAIPVLGTGKFDLKRLHELAIEEMAGLSRSGDNP